MAPLPVISDVWRVTINYAQSAGVQPVNVFHLRSPSGDASEIADAINAAVGTKPMMDGMDPSFQPPNFSLIPLDGSSATSVHSFDPDTWTTDTSSGDWSPASAAVVTLRTAVRGPRGRGRVYVGPQSEAAIDSGILVGDVPIDLQAAWNDFNDALAAGDPAIALGVASYVHADFNPVISCTVSTILGTQRRRQDQLR